MRVFGNMWIPFLIGMLIVLSPILLFKIHSDYTKKAELSKLGLVFLYIFHGLFCMTIINATFYSKLLFAPENLIFKFIGYIFILVGIILIVEAFIEFRSFKRINCLIADKLISTGVYRFSRNPQGIGYHLILLGFSLPYRSVIAIILILIHLIIYDRIFVSGEERYLQKSLGDEFAQYKKRVRRWI